jgi:hypothetical protein
MIGLLLRVAVGVIAAAATAAVVYTVYKKITKKTIVEEAKKQLEKNDVFEAALKAKITEVQKSQGTVTVDILDSWDNDVLTDVEVHGEEIANNLREGQEILLDEAC